MAVPGIKSMAASFRSSTESLYAARITSIGEVIDTTLESLRAQLDDGSVDVLYQVAAL